jgi:hypothetical protein
MALAKLHNFCIDESDVPLRERHHDDVLDRDIFDVMLNDDYIDHEELNNIASCRTGTRRRNRFRVILEQKGLCRPQYKIKSIINT